MSRTETHVNAMLISIVRAKVQPCRFPVYLIRIKMNNIINVNEITLFKLVNDVIVGTPSLNQQPIFISDIKKRRLVS